MASVNGSGLARLAGGASGKQAGSASSSSPARSFANATLLAKPPGERTGRLASEPPLPTSSRADKASWILAKYAERAGVQRDLADGELTSALCEAVGAVPAVRRYYATGAPFHALPPDAQVSWRVLQKLAGVGAGRSRL